MRTEYHCHIIPQIDDGSKSVEMSLEMIRMMQEQGVERICATPHFYAHRWQSVEQYMEVRQQAFNKLVTVGGNSLPPIYLGAEVSIERGISELKDIDKLAIQGTSLILLELQYKRYESWMTEEIENISAEYGLTPIIAHVHRYFDDYSDEQVEHIINLEAIKQCNIECFQTRREKKLAKLLMKGGYSLVFGSDAHNLDDRKPNWDLGVKKIPEDVLRRSDRVFDEYSI